MLSHAGKSLVAALALVLTVGAVASAPAVADETRVGSDDGSGSGTSLQVPVHLGTYNIQSKRSFGEFRQGVEALEERVAVAGLQEIGGNDKRRYLEESPTWGFYRPPNLQQNPVIWDYSQFVFVAGRGALLARGRDIGDEKPGFDGARKDAYATVVHLLHNPTGQAISVINVHLLPGAISGGRPRADRPLMVKMYKEEVASLAATARTESQFGRVFVLGDFNVGYDADERWQRKRLPYVQLTALSLISMWRDCDTSGRGTHGRAYIDQIWSVEPADSCEVAYDVQHSDHYPVIGTYGLDILPLPLLG